MSFLPVVLVLMTSEDVVAVLILFPTESASADVVGGTADGEDQESFAKSLAEVLSTQTYDR